MDEERLIIPIEPRQGDTAKCRHCHKNITFYETAIDNFWAHDSVKYAPVLMHCTEPGRRLDTYAEPQEI